MSARSLLRECLWPGDARSTREIEAGVREELQAHVDRLVDEQLRAGVPEDEARRRAAQQFGDVERYAAKCRRIDLAERLIVRRALAVACVLLAAACGYLAWRVGRSEQLADRLLQELATAENPVPPPRPTHDEWVKRLVSLRDHMHTAFAVGPELTLLDADEGLAIVREAWPQIYIREVKTGLLKAFEFSKALPRAHPRLLQVLHLGMTDPDANVRSYAAEYLKAHAGEDFDSHPERYEAWYRQYGQPAANARQAGDHSIAVPASYENGVRKWK